MDATKMTLFLLYGFVLGIFICPSLAQKVKYQSCYKLGEGEAACMTVVVDRGTKLVSFHMGEGNGFEDVSTVEDYNTGFAASRIEAQDGCFVRQVTNTLKEQEAFLAAHQNTTHDIEPATDVNVMAVPLEDPEGTIGETLVDFCGELPVYKMVKDEKEEEGEESEESEESGEEKGVARRQVKVSFRLCYLLFFYPICTVTTVVIPTGISIVFPWFCLPFKLPFVFFG